MYTQDCLLQNYERQPKTENQPNHHYQVVIIKDTLQRTGLSQTGNSFIKHMHMHTHF